MSNSRLWRVVITDVGVYQPPPLMLEGALLGCALLVVVASVVLGRTTLASAWPGLLLVAAAAVARFIAYRKHGSLGKPCITLRQGTLVLALPQESRGQVVLALAEFQQLIVYGRIGRRVCRFVRHNGTHVEVTPGWRARVEWAAVEFLQRQLPPAVKVTVEEPQTLFASIRGDGP